MITLYRVPFSPTEARGASAGTVTHRYSRPEGMLMSIETGQDRIGVPLWSHRADLLHGILDDRLEQLVDIGNRGA